MRHIFVCTTLYKEHWANTVSKKMAEAAKLTDAEKAARQAIKPEEHADGHIGAHCGEKVGGDLYEAFKAALRDRDIDDVLLSPNACIAQHVAGCMVMIYPDGIWYALHSVDEVERIVDSHLVNGQVVEELVHRRLKEHDGRGLACALADAGAGST